MSEPRIVISGGGTGGHIFPAVSIANAIRELEPQSKILFVGAEGRMEMQRVPAAGYEIVGLPIRGLIRPLWKPANIGVAIDFLKSKRMAKKTLHDFRPDVAVGVGGYASSATLNAAYEMRGRIDEMIERTGEGNSDTLLEMYASYQMEGKSLGDEAEKAFSLITDVDQILRNQEVVKPFALDQVSMGTGMTMSHTAKELVKDDGDN